MDWKSAKQRSAIRAEVRNFFLKKNYMEVDTPLLSPDLIPESTIEIFKSEMVDPHRGNRELFLVPSPEIWMKKLLSKGSGDIFQIGKSFRNSEQSGKQHNREFTMIEWYKTEYSYKENILETEELFQSLMTGESPEYIRPPFRRMTVEEAFQKYAGFSLEKNNTEATLRNKVEKLSIPTDSEDQWETLFNRIFLHCIEPSLPQDRPLILYNYPAQIRTLAQKLEGTIWSERWELYAGGMELANCYTEETDPVKIREYFIEQSDIKEKTALVKHRVDHEYYQYFGPHFPNCSGVALGLDRLIMLLTGRSSIDEVILFPQA